MTRVKCDIGAQNDALVDEGYMWLWCAMPVPKASYVFTVAKEMAPPTNPRLVILAAECIKYSKTCKDA